MIAYEAYRLRNNMIKLDTIGFSIGSNIKTENNKQNNK